jgi:DHA2 family lincomycin resistance protein-like MFS transporter
VNTSSPAVAGGERTSREDMVVLRWLVVATFVVILNETIMANAIPRLATDFSVSLRTAQWLTTAFMLAMAIVIPVTGWFLQRVTTRQAFALAMIVFCTGTLIAAVAPWFWLLIVGRVVQASGTAVMMPLLMTTLMSVVPESDRGRVMGNVTLAMSVAPALGPAVSGVILQSLSWRWMFGIVLPLAAIIGVLGLRRMRNVGERTTASVDVVSVLMAALGFGPVVYGLSLLGAPSAPVNPWVLIGGGAVIVVLFVVRQLQLQRIGAPLLDLRTLKHRTYTLSLLLMVFAFMGFLGSMILVPLYLQNARGLSVLETGLMMMPGGLAMGLLGPRVGRIFDAHGGRVLVIPGSVGVVAALAVFSQINLHTPYWLILAAHIVLMSSLAAVFTPVFTLGLGSVPPQLYSHASSLLGALQQVAGAVGTAISIVVASTVAHFSQTNPATLTPGLGRAFLVSAIVSVLVVILAVLLPARLPGGANDGQIEDLAEGPSGALEELVS